MSFRCSFCNCARSTECGNAFFMLRVIEPMSDQVFYVGALDRDGKFSGHVKARFLTINGQPVVDPTPGGPDKRIPYIYAGDQGADKSDRANPNNYVIVPANFTEDQARAYAAQISRIQNIPVVGTPWALKRMFFDFKPKGSQDLQRGLQWGIPEGSVVPAFVSGASHYLGFVSGLTGIPLELSEIGGKATNPYNKDPSGPYGISQQNFQNLVRGQSDATAMHSPVWMANNFGYGSQGQTPAGQIGDGTGARWISSLRGIDPLNPTLAAGPQRASGPLGLVSNQPMPDWPFPPPIFNKR